MKFYQMDNLKAAIIDDNFFIYMPGENPKYSKLAHNPVHCEIIQRMGEPISKEEFEKDIPKNNTSSCIFAAVYYTAIEQHLVINN